MPYELIQQQVYDNKVRRSFNVSDIGKEIILITEEYGELCEAYLEEDKELIVDSIGDIMIYCFGLNAMFQWRSSEVVNNDLALPQQPDSLNDFFPYAGREIGLLAKTYKKSNKLKVDQINLRDNFKEHIGNLMSYCKAMFRYVRADERSVLEGIVSNNKIRTHQGKI